MDGPEYMQKFSNMRCQRVQVDDSFVPSLQDEVVEVEHLLAEPRNDHVSVDGILYFHDDNKGKCYDAENLYYGFELGLKSNIGSLDPHTTLNGKDEVLDGLLNDVEIHDLHGTDDFSGGCEEYFLDFDFADKAEVLGSSLCEGSLLQISSLESHSPGLSGGSIIGGVSEATKAPIEQFECTNDSLDETVTCKTHAVFRNNPSPPSNVDSVYQNSLGMRHLEEFDRDHPVAGVILSCKKENDFVEKCQPSAPREKRCRKPTLRYIEEFSNLRSKEKVSTAATKNKHLSQLACYKLHNRHESLRKIPGEKFENRNSEVALPALKVCKERPKKEEFEYDEEPFTSESEDECSMPKKSKREDRRKHQRLWTLSEVMKLVDGISEYGVSRWTDIKRSLFSSSSYRTPMDIRDKWRNLLRASSSPCQKFNKEEAEQNELSLRPLPFDLVNRVRELAEIHPYPRQQSSNKSSIGLVGSSAVSGQSKGTSLISLSKRRNVRRGKCI